MPNPATPYVGAHRSAMLRAPVLDVGRPARDLLTRSRRWKVIARFRRSAYCRDGAGNIVCLGDISIGRGPLNVRCALPSPSDWRIVELDVGRVVDVDGHILRMGKRTQLFLDRAETWEPPIVRGLRNVSTARLQPLLDAAARQAPDTGLGWVFRLPVSDDAAGVASIASSGGVTAAAMPAITSLARWLEDSLVTPATRIPPSPMDVAGLIGLGPGLTPSGDDFLGGLMIGLRTMNRVDLADGLVRIVLREARQSTNAISYAHLACAAHGQGSEALHQILAAITARGPIEVGPYLEGIERMGATSGWDALAGAFLPLRIYLDARTPAPPVGG